MSDKLLPCPFCGQDKVYVNAPIENIGFKGSINCPSCLVAIPREVNSDDELISAWNTRTNPSQAQLAAARSALEPFAKAADAAAWPTFERDNCYIDSSFNVTVGNLRKARAVYSTLAQEPAGQSEATPLPKLNKRRPLIGSKPDGYMESDRDFIENNFDAAVLLLESALAAHPTVKVSGDAAPRSAELDDENPYDNEMFNKGVLHAQAILNKQIGNPDYVASDGSEDYDTDLGDTILNQLAAAGLYDKEEGRFATLPRSAEMSAEEVREAAANAAQTAFGRISSKDYALGGPARMAMEMIGAIRALPLTPEGRS